MTVSTWLLSLHRLLWNEKLDSLIVINDNIITELSGQLFSSMPRWEDDSLRI